MQHWEQLTVLCRELLLSGVPPLYSQVVRFCFRTPDRNIVISVKLIRAFSGNAFPFRDSEAPDLQT
jgi:hypothetical protein